MVCKLVNTVPKPQLEKQTKNYFPFSKKEGFRNIIFQKSVKNHCHSFLPNGDGHSHINRVQRKSIHVFFQGSYSLFHIRMKFRFRM